MAFVSHAVTGSTESLPAYTRKPLPPFPPPPAYSRIDPEPGQERVQPPDVLFMDKPPAYSPFDGKARWLSFSGPFISTTSANGSIQPRYQVAQKFSKSGRLWQISIRRLLPAESRRICSHPKADVAFEDDAVLYQIENAGALGMFSRARITITGRKAMALKGHVEMIITARNDIRFIQRIRAVGSAPSLDAIQQQMQKWGYKPDEDTQERLLFTSKWSRRNDCYHWTDGCGLLLATEVSNGLALETELDDGVRDALVTCVTACSWVTGRLNFRDDRARHA